MIYGMPKAALEAGVVAPRGPPRAAWPTRSWPRCRISCDYSPMSLTGNLEDLPLLDILQIVSFSKKTGHLTIRAAAGEGAIVFRDGLVVAPSPGTARRSTARVRSLAAEKRDQLLRSRIEMALEQLIRLREGQFSFSLSDELRRRQVDDARHPGRDAGDRHQPPGAAAGPGARHGRGPPQLDRRCSRRRSRSRPASRRRWRSRPRTSRRSSSSSPTDDLEDEDGSRALRRCRVPHGGARLEPRRRRRLPTRRAVAPVPQPDAAPPASVAPPAAAAEPSGAAAGGRRGGRAPGAGRAPDAGRATRWWRPTTPTPRSRRRTGSARPASPSSWSRTSACRPRAAPRSRAASRW